MIDSLRLKLKKAYSILRGRATHLKAEAKITKQWYGSRYGGFYACPDTLNQDSIVYSVGIGTDVSFDLDIISKHQCSVFGFDPTPKSIDYIKTANLPDKFHFYNIGLAQESRITKFFLPKDENHVSGSIVQQNNINKNNSIDVEMMCLTDLAKKLGHKQIDVLKIDIEGAEYEVIETIVQSEIEIKQVLIEFHDRLFENGLQLTRQATKKLKTNGYQIFAVSDLMQEVSFIKQE